MEVTEPLRNALLNCSGEEVLGWCQAFKRVLIKGEVFHSKSYGRVYRRNSYTVTYEDNNCNHRSQCNCIKTAYGQVQHFIKHTPACQNGCVALCNCNREQYFAIVMKLQPKQDFQLFENAGIGRMREHLQAMQRPRYKSFIQMFRQVNHIGKRTSFCIFELLAFIKHLRS